MPDSVTADFSFTPRSQLRRGLTPPLNPLWQPLMQGFATVAPDLPRTLPSPGHSLLEAPLKPFTHRHLIHDTERQREVLARMANALANGKVELDTVVEVLRTAEQRLAAGGALAPELAKLVRACATVPPRRHPADQEEANRAARRALLDAISSLARASDASLRYEAREALGSLLKLASWPTAPARDSGSLPPGQSMATALAYGGGGATGIGVAGSGAAAHAVSALFEADGPESLRDACAVLMSMARSSAYARRQLLQCGAAKEIVRRLHGEAEHAGTRLLPLPAARDSESVAPAEAAAPRRETVGARGVITASELGDADADNDGEEDGGKPPSLHDLETPSYSSKKRPATSGPAIRRKPVHVTPIREPSWLAPEPGAIGMVRGIGGTLLDLVNMLCDPGDATQPADNGGGTLPSEAEYIASEGREAIVSAGGARAVAALLAASLRGGRSAAERKLRCEALVALTALSMGKSGPRRLREAGVLRLLALVLGGPSESPYSAAARLWVAPIAMAFDDTAQDKEGDLFVVDPGSGEPMQVRRTLPTASRNCLSRPRADFGLAVARSARLVLHSPSSRASLCHHPLRRRRSCEACSPPTQPSALKCSVRGMRTPITWSHGASFVVPLSGLDSPASTCTRRINCTLISTETAPAASCVTRALEPTQELDVCD